LLPNHKLIQQTTINLVAAASEISEINPDIYRSREFATVHQIRESGKFPKLIRSRGRNFLSQLSL